MADTHGNLHIAMLPWFAFGHMTPYMELAKLMAGKGDRISFLSTPRNIDRLPKPPPDLAPLISFVKLPLPAIEHLPEGAEATRNLPYDKIQYLKKAFDMLQGPMAQFLQSSDPDWIVYDFAPYWAGQIASRLGIGRVLFTIMIGAGLGFIGPTWASKGGDNRKTPEDFSVPPKWVPFPTKVAFLQFEIKKIFDVVTGNASGVTDLYRMGAGQECCDIIALRSSYDVEPEWLSLLNDMHAKPVFPVGQLPPGDPETRGETDSWRSIKEWLDAQKKDQGLNARLLEERQIGYPIPRNESDRLVTRQSVAESLGLVMVEEKGRVYREKAKEMRSIVGDKNIQESYVNKLLNYLQEHRPAKHQKSKGTTIQGMKL
ncbi:hypothetical protein NL676_022672 [Syzygium grande]|nr:hypothetical protein NL676_022672 [Syzygium grande]